MPNEYSNLTYSDEKEGDKRRSTLLSLRWLIFLWLSAYAAYLLKEDFYLAMRVFGILGLLATSQAALWRLDGRHFRGMKLPQIIFLFDVNVIVWSLWILGRFQVGLVVAMFLTVFMAAMVRRLKPTLMLGAVGAGIYIAWKLYTPEGLQMAKPEQLLELPLIMVMAIHASVLINFSQADAKIRQALEMDRKFLSRRLKESDQEREAVKKNADELFDMLPLGAVMVDTHGFVIMVNQYAEMVMGQGRRFVLGMQMEAVPALAGMRALIRTGYSRRAEDLVEMVDETMEPMVFRVESFPVRHKQGEVFASMAMISPVTQPQHPEKKGMPALAMASRAPSLC